MPRVRKTDITWVEPVLVAEVEFAEWTHEGRLRSPSYLRLREDMTAPDVRREREPLPTSVRRGRRELRLSNLDKPFWPEEGITKGDLIAYYRDVAEVLVPHLRGRPFTMKRYPDGWQGKSFFQKNAPSHMPEWIERAPFPASTREGEKKHHRLRGRERRASRSCGWPTWAASTCTRGPRGSTARSVPDWVMFDLDPSEGSSFEEVVEVAQLVKQTLDLLELASYPKTSGSRGIHVLVPIARRHSFEEVREFAGIVAGRARTCAPRSRDDRVGEAEASRRARRREPERAREDERKRLLGAPSCGRAGVHATALGRGRVGARSCGIHDGHRARPGRTRR